MSSGVLESSLASDQGACLSVYWLQRVMYFMTASRASEMA